MTRKFITTGLFFIVFGIILGALAAHGLKKIGIKNEQIESFEVGVRYLFYNGIGFLAIAGIRKHIDFLLKLHYRSIMWGTILFSGSIFLMVVLPVLEISINDILGPITPIGGVLMIIGWGTLLIKHLRNVI